MPGPIDVNPRVIKPPTDIARKVGERANGSPIYQAGPDAKGYKPGQIVPNTYAEKARAIRQNTNMLKQVMEWNNESETEARATIRQVRAEMADVNTEAERREIWQSYVAS